MNSWIYLEIKNVFFFFCVAPIKKWKGSYRWHLFFSIVHLREVQYDRCSFHGVHALSEVYRKMHFSDSVFDLSCILDQIKNRSNTNYFFFLWETLRFDSDIHWFWTVIFCQLYSTQTCKWTKNIKWRYSSTYFGWTGCDEIVLIRHQGYMDSDISFICMITISLGTQLRVIPSEISRYSEFHDVSRFHT